MAKALMIGGVFLLARDPVALAAWYQRYLGWEFAQVSEDRCYLEAWYRFDDRPETRQQLVFAIMRGEPGVGSRLNHLVDDVASIAASLEADGVEVSPVEFYEGQGTFAWLHDPEGNRVELWQADN
jgi:predicted enzyme related to lactoylglutathione lyase